MEKNKMEIRSTKGLQIRSEEGVNSRKVSGYAIRFEEESANLGFYETIEKGALTQEQIDNSDIFAFYNHDSEKVLARSVNNEGTLHLELRDDGLYYEFEAPFTEIGNELLEHIKRGELFGSSFCFTVPEDKSGEHWEKRDDGTFHRTIIKIENLFEVSPVFQPAYPTTSCSVRSKSKDIEKFEDLINRLDNKINDIEEISKY